MKQTFRLNDYLSEHNEPDKPKVSIYLPTHRSLPDARQDPILYKNQLQKIQAELEQKYNRRDWGPLMNHLNQIHDDSDFWTYSTEGLAILADETGAQVIHLYQPVPERVVVGQDFDVVPLLRYHEGNHRGYLVDIGRDRVNLYRVNQHGAEKVKEADFMKNFPELFDDFDDENRMNMGGNRLDATQAVMHGNKAKPEEMEKDREKYFRYINQQLRKFIDKDTPVIIAGTTENVSEYKELAKGDFYTKQSIEKPFDSIDHNEQRKILRDILRPRYRERMQTELDDYHYQQSQGKTVYGLPKITEQAELGRVKTVFINADYEPQSQIELNDMIKRVMTSGGEVIILTEDKLDKDLSAVLRY